MKTVICPALVLLASATHAATPTVADFARHGEFTDVKISPKGDYLAATSEAGNKTVLVLLDRKDLSSGTVLQQPSNNHVYWFEWASPDRILYKRNVKSGAYDFPLNYGQIFASDADGTDHGPIFGFEGTERTGATRIRSNTGEQAAGRVIDLLPDDARHVLISQVPFSRETNRFSTIEKLDIARGVRTKVDRLPVRNASATCDLEGEPRFAAGFDESYDWRVMYRPILGEDWVHVSELSAAGFSPRRYAADGVSVLGLCPLGEDAVQGVCSFNTETNELSAVIQHDEFDVTGLLVDPVTGRPIGAYSHSDIPKVEFFDESSPFVARYRQIQAAFKGQTTLITSATDDGSLMVVHVSSATNPGDFYLFDTRTNDARYLVSERSWIASEQMGAMEPIEYEARDGMTIHGYVTYPLGSARKNLPMIVLPHGGPHGPRDTWSFQPEVQYLASRGYAVLQPNFRGSGGYGNAFEEAGYREWGAAMQDDVTDATLWAIDQGIADDDRICTYGGSYGGYAALMAVAREPDLYRCAVGSAGVYDLELMFKRGDIRKWMAGQAYMERALSDEPEFLRARSPITYVNNIKVPVMLIHGGQDLRVPPVHAKNLRKALKKAGNAPEWLYFPREAHGYYDEKNRAKMFTRLGDFLDKHTAVRAARVVAP
ncbi:MAG: S9 family peptidase [Pseudomonadota bacterium]